MKRRVLVVMGIGCVAALVYACGGSDNTLNDGGPDEGTDTTVPDTGTKDTGTKDTGSSDTGTSDAGTSDTGTSDTGTDTGTSDAGTDDSGDGGVTEAGCYDGGTCPGYGPSCDDAGGCPSGEICVTQTKVLTVSHTCYPLPTCGCTTSSMCACVGGCACGKEPCTDEDGGGIYCQGPISRREFKTDIRYLSDTDREALAARTLTTENDQDLYGYTSSVLAAVQAQQKQIDDLKKQVHELQ